MARLGIGLALVLLAASGKDNITRAESPDPSQTAATPPALPSVAEARERAELLHEAMHATLQIVHRQYFREDEGLAIPAATLRTVFRELARREHVELRWLSVNAQPMNTDHEPVSDFEKEAARKITTGATSHEQVDGGVYRRVGAITLESDCLKCHLPTRTDVRPRAAGLLISIPIHGD